ncbi:tetratricopeptide repeat protein [Vibrio furnissii]|uniref:tetratricopeptide repeat protein n=1 Tax=Vibrio furnissii TaxID=29494 RepID=UPI0012AD5E7A|nr:tetratricopeptide repeat protein [Vibrio furnissii]
MKRTITLSIAALTLGATMSVAAAGADPLQTIQKKWAVCQYQSKDKDHQVYCLENLIQRNEEALKAAPERQELKLWLAINKSSLAGVDGGLGALSLVKEAKVLLEQVIETAPETLDGSAYTSLGSLYYQVPGWPIGFGDDDKAEAMLKKALEINPDGIDPNYFYGDFLAQDGRKAEAIQYLTKAQQAKPRPARPLADQGRQQEIAKKLGALN